MNANENATNDRFWDIVADSYTDSEFAELSVWTDKMIEMSVSNPEWTV